MIEERLIALINYECPNERTKYKDFSDKTGINKETLRALCNKRQKFNSEHINVISEFYPEYKHWLVFGEELPEAGQISPMTNEVKGTG